MPVWHLDLCLGVGKSLIQKDVLVDKAGSMSRDKGESSSDTNTASSKKRNCVHQDTGCLFQIVMTCVGM